MVDDNPGLGPVCSLLGTVVYGPWTGQCYLSCYKSTYEDRLMLNIRLNNASNFCEHVDNKEFLKNDLYSLVTSLTFLSKYLKKNH